MADSDVSVRFGADATGLQSGTDAAAEAVAAFGGQVGEVSEAIRAQTEAMGEGFAELGHIITEAMHEAEAETEKETGALRELLSTTRETVEGITELREAFSGIAEAVMAAFAVEWLTEWSRKMGESGEKTEHTAAMLGTSVGNVQLLGGAFQLMGVSSDKGTNSILKLDRAFAQARQGTTRQVQAFQELGISTTQNYTQMELLGDVMDGFKDMANGPAKAAESMALFGRAGAAMIPFLNQGKEGLADLIRVESQYGVENADAVEKSAQLGSAWNENSVAMTGLGNVMAEAFAPVLTQVVQGMNGMIASFIKSYNAGGDAKLAVNLLVDAFKILISIAVSLGEAFIATFYFIKAVVEDFQFTWFNITTTIKTDVAAVKVELDTFGKVAKDAFSLNWGAIASDWQSGMDKAAEIVRKGAAKIAAERVKVTPVVNSDLAKAGAALGPNKFLQNMWNGKPKEQKDSTGEGDGDTSGLPTGKGKKPKDDMVSQWTEQLRQIDDLQQNWYADQNALAAKFWAGIVKSGVGSAKDQQQAQDNLSEALKSLDNEQVTSAVEAAKKKADAAKGDVDQVKAIYADLEATLTAHHAQGGAEWDKVEQAKIDAVRKATLEMQAAQTERIAHHGADEVKDDQTEGKTADIGLQTQQTAVKAQGATGQLNPKQEAQQLAAIDQEIEANDLGTQERILDHQIATLNAEIAANQGNADKIKGFTQQIEDDKKASADRMAEIMAEGANREAQAQIQAAERVQQAWKQNVGTIVQSFGSGILNMAQHGGSFQQVMMGVVGTIEQQFAKSIETMVTNFIVGEATKKTVAVTSQAAQTAATTAGETTRTAVQQAGASQGLLISLETTLKNVTNNAVNAASAAYGAMAGIPIIGPALGAAAAAVTFTAVEAFGALASASGGYDIGNENPLTQLHAQEMVLPASIATPLRGMIAANGNVSSGSGMNGGARGGGDTYHTSINALDSRSVKRMMNNPGNVRAAGAAARKHG